jgi:hypothetical protein
MSALLRFVTCIHWGADDPLHHSGSRVSFDSALSRLETLPRFFIEPDGSFVWRGVMANGQDWQLDGNLIDRGDVLDYVELQGSCPSERLDEILLALGWPDAALAFQLPRLGQFLTEAEFRRQAATPAGAG